MWLVPLQQKLIHEILMGKSVYIRDDCDGVHMIKNRLCHKKILLVLDDPKKWWDKRDNKVMFGLGEF